MSVVKRKRMGHGSEPGREGLNPETDEPRAVPWSEYDAAKRMLDSLPSRWEADSLATRAVLYDLQVLARGLELREQRLSPLPPNAVALWELARSVAHLAMVATAGTDTDKHREHSAQLLRAEALAALRGKGKAVAESTLKIREIMAQVRAANERYLRALHALNAFESGRAPVLSARLRPKDRHRASGVQRHEARTLRDTLDTAHSAPFIWLEQAWAKYWPSEPFPQRAAVAFGAAARAFHLRAGGRGKGWHAPFRVLLRQGFRGVNVDAKQLARIRKQIQDM